MGSNSNSRHHSFEEEKVSLPDEDYDFSAGLSQIKKSSGQGGVGALIGKFNKHVDELSDKRNSQHEPIDRSSLKKRTSGKEKNVKTKTKSHTMSKLRDELCLDNKDNTSASRKEANDVPVPDRRQKARVSINETSAAPSETETEKRQQRIYQTQQANHERKRLSRLSKQHISKRNLEIVCTSPCFEDDDTSAFTPPTFTIKPGQADIIKTALADNFVFDDLIDRPKDLKTFIHAFESVTYEAGDTIIQQGDKGDYFYVVESGAVDFLVNGSKVGSASGKSKSFGELALLYTAPRAATVVAATEGSLKLFRVDRKSFRYILQKQMQDSEAQKRELLSGVPFAKHLSAQNISRLVNVMTPRFFKSHEILIQKGEQGDAFYILAEGTMQVTDISVGNVQYEDVTLSPGEYFGERALITSEPRAAYVSGVTDGYVFTIDRSTFQRVLGTYGRVIVQSQDRHKLEGIKVIKDVGLTAGDMECLASCIQDQEYKRNQKIIKEGEEIKPALYIVREGAVELVYDGGRRRERINAGGYFGEELLLADSDTAPGIDTVVAEFSAVALTKYSQTTPCVCGVLTLDDCRSIFDTTKMDGQVNEGEGTVLDMIMHDSSLMDITKVKGFEKVMERRNSLRASIQGNVDLDDLKRHSILGEGQFGEVWLVSADPFGTQDEDMVEEFALKVQSKEDDLRKDSAAMSIKQEISAIQKLNHPFIVNLVNTYQDEKSHYMLLGLINGGELWSVIHQEDETSGEWTSGISEQQGRFYSLIVADTLAYMHRQHYVYRDLKPENVMIDDDGYPVIVDFGFAKDISKAAGDKTYTFCVSGFSFSTKLPLTKESANACNSFNLCLLYTMYSPIVFTGNTKLFGA